MFRFLIFGDCMGRIGRRAVMQVLPELKERYRPHLTFLNAENLAHGFGVTPLTLTEMRDAGIDVFTSGNHIWANHNVAEASALERMTLLRPANYSSANPGRGTALVTIAAPDAEGTVLVINLQGRIFMKDQVENPFLMLESILNSSDAQRANAIVVDFHAEASSEKVALCLHAGGRVAAVWGTHSHVPTADARILPGGTAAITDVGMSGAAGSVIGFDAHDAIEGYRKGLLAKAGIPETGPAEVNALYVEVDNATGKSVHCEYIHRDIIIL